MVDQLHTPHIVLNNNNQPDTFDHFTPAEIQLVRSYRKLDADDQEFIKDLSDVLGKNSEKNQSVHPKLSLVHGGA